MIVERIADNEKTRAGRDCAKVREQPAQGYNKRNSESYRRRDTQGNDQRICESAWSNGQIRNQKRASRQHKHAWMHGKLITLTQEKVMRVIGYIVVVAALAVAGLIYGGYIGGDVEAQLTDKGRQTYNQGIDVVQENVGKLKAPAPAAEKK